MSLPGGVPRKLAEAVEAHVGRGGSDRPVSVKSIMEATRSMMQELGLSEKELSDLIAMKLVAMGRNIHFNMGEAIPPLPGEEKWPKRAQDQAVDRVAVGPGR